MADPTPLPADRLGEGPPVLLLPSGLWDRRMWEPMLPWLTAGFEVLSVDLPGTGEAPDADPGVGAHEAVIATLEAEGLEQVAIVGASYGAGVAVDVALARPDLIADLVLVGPIVEGWPWSERQETFFRSVRALAERRGPEAAAQAEITWWIDGGRETVNIGENTYDALLDANEANVARGSAESASLEPSAIERLETLPVAPLVLVGELDREDVQAIADMFGEEANATVEAITGTTHLPSVERPATVGARIVDRLQTGV